MESLIYDPNACLVWDGEKILVVKPYEGYSQISVNHFPEELESKFVVDLARELPKGRYGCFYIDGTHGSKCMEWRHIPFSQFPPEFKAYLLLLGVQ